MTGKKKTHVPMGTLFESARLKLTLDAASQSHVDSCELCRSRLSWMQTTSDLGPHESDFEPPPAAMDVVLGLAGRRNRKFPKHHRRSF